MAEYTYKDIIIDPNSEEAKNAVGKEVYYGDSPTGTLDNAIENRNAVILDSIELKENMPFKVDLGFEGFSLFSCIIVKKEESYEERENKWVEGNDLKVGDYIQVLRKAESYERGWPLAWIDEMDDCIGKTMKVLKIDNQGVKLENNCRFPYFVLEKVKEPKYIPFESAEEFLERYTEVMECEEYNTFNDRLFQFGMWLKYGGEYVHVTHISENGITTRGIYREWYSMLATHEFLDGSPCGKEVKDV